jgi:hypothetical protein
MHTQIILRLFSWCHAWTVGQVSVKHWAALNVVETEWNIAETMTMEQSLRAEVQNSVSSHDHANGRQIKGDSTSATHEAFQNFKLSTWCIHGQSRQIRTGTGALLSPQKLHAYSVGRTTCHV